MTNRLSTCLLLFLFCCCLAAPQPLQAQTNLVRHYTINDGLSNNAVYAITQDDKGRMWFGTIDGLHSFDGHAIHVWRDSTRLAPGPIIYALREDDDYRLWVGSDKGLSLLDLKLERWVPLGCVTSAGVSITSSVTDILKDSRGRMWVSTFGQGVFRYDPASHSLEQYTLGRLNTEYAICLMEDSRGTVWCASRTEGVSRYDEARDRFAYVTGSRKEAVIRLFEDSSHRIWAGGNRNGLFRLENDSLYHCLEPVGESGVMQVRSIVERKRGQLLLASDEGLTRYIPDKGEAVTLKADPDHPNKMNDNCLQTLYLDSESALWTGTYFGGVNYFSPEGDNFSHYRDDNTQLASRIIGVIAPAEEGNLWIGSDDNGFFHWNRKENRFTHYPSGGHKPFSPTYHNIHALLQDGNRLFVGMFIGGLDIIDLKTGKVRNYMPSNSSRSLYASGIYALHRDGDGRIWIGTTMGLNSYEPATDDFERIYQTYQADISCIADDRSGYLWVGSLNKGLFRLDRESRMWDNFSSDRPEDDPFHLGSDGIITCTTDETGGFWIGTNGNGLFRFDYATGRFERVHFEVPLRVIYKIIPYQNKLWLTTNQGLYAYDPATRMLSYYNREDGLQGNAFLPNSGLLADDGTLFVGGINGFNSFRPDRMTHFSAVRPQVILTDFRLFNRPVEVGAEGSPLKHSITYSTDITLNHEQSIFGLQVAALSYINPSKNFYRYRLEGLEEEWTFSREAPRVSYTNLRPGRYTFRVSVSTGNGQWFDDAVRLSIRVLPPWWLSPWALAAYVLLLALLVSLLYRRSVNRQRERLALVTIEKDKEIYQSKIDFFTQMVHELRTPLSLILAPLRQVMAQGGSVADAMPQLQMVERNGQRLSDVVNQLMDFRKSESGQITVSLASVELKGVLSGIVQRFRWLAEAKGIRLVEQLPEAECFATTDTEAFNKMVGNLLSNAFKFASTSVTITLSQDGEGCCLLRVADDGIGIAPEEQAKIFQPFYQVKEGRPSDYIGTGIGLALVRKLADLTHTEISVESSLGQGAAFILRLPAGQPLSEVRPDAVQTSSGGSAMALSEPSAAEPAADGERECILVVDDNSDMLHFMQSILASRYEVRLAGNGQEALDVMKQWLPQLIVSDVMMPVMDGLQLCRAVKENLETSHVPVVLLTAKVGTESQVEGLDSGADLYLSKPFTTEVMLAQIDSLLRNRRNLKARYCSDPLSLPELPSRSSLDREFVKRVEEIIHQSLTQSDFSVDQLAVQAGVSRTALFTKLKALVGLTPNDYIRLIRLKRAAQLLSSGNTTVSEACWLVGFSSTSYFSKCFQSQFGVTPSEFRQRSEKKE